MTLYTPEIFTSFDCLLERRVRLEQMTEIQDMQAYAVEWQKLADDFREIGLLSNAAMCETKAQHYSEMSGAYERKIELPFAELIPVREMEVGEGQFITDWIV